MTTVKSFMTLTPGWRAWLTSRCKQACPPLEGWTQWAENIIKKTLYSYSL
jgi:hypothetical protein